MYYGKSLQNYYSVEDFRHMTCGFILLAVIHHLTAVACRGFSFSMVTVIVMEKSSVH